ncbi:hypothetical protein V565_083020 [Rhizoctonia solani 123E]|uniref:Uncharacterized protein n=1 Tax=Rhizoctonia solani 123E TaxID=1423351 RepID=A0A074SJX5_9AGAM|nr:hypothetical protein V565_083020 [Rhizoctonia solani 123E]
MGESHTSSLLHPIVERLHLHNLQAESKPVNRTRMNHQVLYIGGTRLPIPRSVSAPVLLSSLSINKTTESGSLADQHVPQTDDLETDESSQEDELVMTPPTTEMDRCGLFEWWDNKPSLFSDCGVTEGDDKPKPGCELRAICSHTYGSGQHFRLAHEYAESAREAAQVQLRLMVASFGSGATYYPTAHAYYYYWAMNVMNWQNHYMYA